MQYAGFWSRAAAGGIDVAVVGVLAVLVYKAGAQISVFLGVPLVAVIYHVGMITQWQGTVGKLLTGLRIVGTDGHPLSMGGALLRTLIALPSYFLFLPLLLCCFTEKRQSLHDRVAKTVVVDCRCREACSPVCDGAGHPLSGLFVILGNLLFVPLLLIYLLALRTLPDMEITVDPNSGALSLSSSSRLIDVAFDAHGSIDVSGSSNALSITGFQFHSGDRERGMRVPAEAADPDPASRLRELIVSRTVDMHFLRNLKQDGFDFDMRYEAEQTPLMLSVIHNNAAMVSFLLDNGAALDLKDDAGKSAWEYIDRKQQRHIYMDFKIREALDAAPPYEGRQSGYSANYDETTDTVTLQRYGENPASWSPLIVAIKEGRHEEAARYIERREFLETPTSNGNTPLLAAVMFNWTDLAEQLLDAGADIEHRNAEGMTPLYMAVLKGNVDAVERLLQRGADMYAMERNGLYSPFTLAADRGDVAMLQRFIAHGVDVNHQNGRSETALTVSAKGCRHIRAFELLLEHGADPNLVDRFGFTTKTGLQRYCSDASAYRQFYRRME